MVACARQTIIRRGACIDIAVVTETIFYSAIVALMVITMVCSGLWFATKDDRCI